MADTNTVARTVRDLGLANWFGGSLMGAVGLNGSAGAVSDPQQRSRVPRAGWQRWTPLEAAGILAVVAGDTVLIASRARTPRRRRLAPSGACGSCSGPSRC